MIKINFEDARTYAFPFRFGNFTWVPKIIIKGDKDFSSDSGSSIEAFQPEIVKSDFMRKRFHKLLFAAAKR